MKTKEKKKYAVYVLRRGKQKKKNEREFAS